MVTTTSSRVGSSSTAMCAAPASPHRPISVQCPAATWLEAKRQPPSLTATRGHGLWRSTLVPSIMSMSAAIGLPEKFCNVLEPRHQRRRQVDTGDEYEPKMSEHRHIRGLG